MALGRQQGGHIAADVPGSTTDENVHTFTIYDLLFAIWGAPRTTRDAKPNSK
jgi:hypothetical protein